jgi:hypothetical protein
VNLILPGDFPGTGGRYCGVFGFAEGESIPVKA